MLRFMSSTVFYIFMIALINKLILIPTFNNFSSKIDVKNMLVLIHFFVIKIRSFLNRAISDSTNQLLISPTRLTSLTAYYL